MSLEVVEHASEPLLAVEDQILFAVALGVQENGGHRKPHQEGLDEPARLHLLPDETALEIGDLDLAVHPLLV